MALELVKIYFAEAVPEHRSRSTDLSANYPSNFPVLIRFPRKKLYRKKDTKNKAPMMC